MVFASRQTDELPIVCESMNETAVALSVREGVGFVMAFLIALNMPVLDRRTLSLLGWRRRIRQGAGLIYLHFEAWMGRWLSCLFTPKLLKKPGREIVIIQIANRDQSPESVKAFETRLKACSIQGMQFMQFVSGSFSERLVLQLRNMAALATLTAADQARGSLFAFDDAIMPGEMFSAYIEQFKEKLTERFPNIHARYFGYGHDLKQISHNDWVIKLPEYKVLPPGVEAQIHAIQREVLETIGGVAHAEHGVGDFADTDWTREELVKFVAHRLLNDFEGIANPGGAPERAWRKALQDLELVQDGIKLAQASLERELLRHTLWVFTSKVKPAQARQLLARKAGSLAGLFK